MNDEALSDGAKMRGEFCECLREPSCGGQAAWCQRLVRCEMATAA